MKARVRAARTLPGCIERIREEKRGLHADETEIFAEAKGSGFDPKIMRIILKERTIDRDEAERQEEVLNIYRRALGMLADLPLGQAALSGAGKRRSDKEEPRPAA